MSGRLYIRLDVDIIDDPHLAAAGERAEVLFLRMMILAKKHLTDGVVNRAQLERLGLPGIDQRLKALLREELIEKHGDAFRICSWGKWNRTAAEVDEIRSKRRAAGRLGGEAKAKQSATDRSSNSLATCHDPDLPKAQSTKHIGKEPPFPHASVGVKPVEKNSRAAGTNPRALQARDLVDARRSVEMQLLDEVAVWVDAHFVPTADIWQVIPSIFNPWQREQADRIWRERLEAT